MSTILVVDDTPTNLDLLMSMLVKRNYNVRPALNGTMALASAFADPPDLVLLDINMPEMSGFEVCRQLKTDERTQDIPVIFISALDDTQDKVKAFEMGGVDYITKPFQVEEVMARIESQLTLYHQRLEIEELRRNEQAHFEEVNRLKDEFVRTVSHDLKNPISVIVGYVTLLLRRGKITDEEDRNYLKQILMGAESMNRLIRDLLDLARIESGMALEPERTLFNHFMNMCVDSFLFAADEKNIDLVVKLPENDQRITIDRTRMGQVLNNLISNAIKYTPNNGRVEVEGRVQDQEVVIIIKDNGMGIPEEALPHLFEKFYRVQHNNDDESEGTGLGLSIVKAIVQQHGGHICAESEVGVGTTFTIVLPLHLEVVA